MAENLDFNSSQLFSGGIDPANLPKVLQGGQCVTIYPHQRLRVNTVFEVVQSKGKETAYADKHPAYDLVRGPSGNGLSVGYFPEIASQANTVDATIAYDQLHVDAFLAWLDATTPDNSQGSLTTIPTLFGGNFQSGECTPHRLCDVDPSLMLKRSKRGTENGRIHKRFR